MAADRSPRISLWLEIVSAVAVVISLVFVGLEIRNSTEQTEQNTRALQLAAYQDLVNRIVDMNAIDIDGATSIEALIALDSLDEPLRQKLASRLWIIFRHGDMAYFQYESGAISAERLRSAMAPVVSRLGFPLVRQHWERTRWAFVPGYRNYIDERIEALGGAASADASTEDGGPPQPTAGR